MVDNNLISTNNQTELNWESDFLESITILEKIYKKIMQEPIIPTPAKAAAAASFLDNGGKFNHGNLE